MVARCFRQRLEERRAVDRARMAQRFARLKQNEREMRQREDDQRRAKKAAERERREALLRAYLIKKDVGSPDPSIHHIAHLFSVIHIYCLIVWNPISGIF
ncbi:unnamed protein product [Protopolystoma xenopodis]|uniref:Uncharacterized protein n=1 Tax=Protopolystoma xenopodis TaxID=117903 RepID=A0A3S5FDL6_9PLAT|nr:unnamed protein product [Protopolystoma xenopodis]